MGLQRTDKVVFSTTGVCIRYIPATITGTVAGADPGGGGPGGPDPPFWNFFKDFSNDISIRCDPAARHVSVLWCLVDPPFQIPGSAPG